MKGVKREVITYIKKELKNRTIDIKTPNHLKARFKHIIIQNKGKYLHLVNIYAPNKTKKDQKSFCFLQLTN